MDTVNPVLARKLGLSPPAADAATEVPPEDAPVATPTRQMRRAMARAADKSLALSASVLGIAQDDMDAETMIESGAADWMVLGLRSGGSAGLTGLFLIDPPMRSAIVEMQTMGNLLPASEDERKVTRTDAVMSIPFADQLLKELAEVGFGAGELDPAAYDMGPIDDLRTAGLVMTPGQYRCWQITVQVGGGERQGQMMIAMRPKITAATAPKSTAPHWADALRDALEEAPAELDAMLTRMVLPISKIEEFVVGQVLHLPGTTVGSVTLTGPGGEPVATARLGQVAGKRAVRVELLAVHLQDDVPRMGAAAMPVPDRLQDIAPANPEGVARSDLVEG